MWRAIPRRPKIPVNGTLAVHAAPNAGSPGSGTATGTLDLGTLPSEKLTGMPARYLGVPGPDRSALRDQTHVVVAPGVPQQRISVAEPHRHHLADRDRVVPAGDQLP